MEVKSILNSWYYAFLGRKTDSWRTFAYWKHVVGTLAFIALVVASFFAYRWYVVHRERAAYATFAECVDQHERATSGDGAVTWNMVADMWQRGYAMHKSSYLAPYFLAYKAKALIENKQIDEAIALLNEAVAMLPKTSPLYYEYQIQASLLAQEPYSLDNLEHWADDVNNPQRDQALYYLGLNYWVNNGLNGAALAWQKLVELSAQSDSPSPWAQLIEDKYKQLEDSGYPLPAAKID